jgi:hypothetical protein
VRRDLRALEWQRCGITCNGPCRPARSAATPQWPLGCGRYYFKRGLKVVRTVSFGEFLDQCERELGAAAPAEDAAADADAEGWYLVQRALVSRGERDAFSRLCDDLFDTKPEGGGGGRATDGGQRCEAEVGTRMRLKHVALWMGCGCDGTHARTHPRPRARAHAHACGMRARARRRKVMPLHYDNNENLLAVSRERVLSQHFASATACSQPQRAQVIDGTKEITLYSPAQRNFLYPFRYSAYLPQRAVARPARYPARHGTSGKVRRVARGQCRVREGAVLLLQHSARGSGLAARLRHGDGRGGAYPAHRHRFRHCDALCS